MNGHPIRTTVGRLSFVVGRLPTNDKRLSTNVLSGQQLADEFGWLRHRSFHAFPRLASPADQPTTSDHRVATGCDYTDSGRSSSIMVGRHCPPKRSKQSLGVLRRPQEKRGLLKTREFASSDECNIRPGVGRASAKLVTNLRHDSRHPLAKQCRSPLARTTPLFRPIDMGDPQRTVTSSDSPL